MAKRTKPSSSDSEEDAPEKKKSRSTVTAKKKQVSNGGGGSSTTSTRRRGTKPASEIANNPLPQRTIAATSSVQVNGGSKGSVTSFLKSARLTKSQPPDASDTTSKNTDATPADSKSDTKDENDPPSQNLNTDTSRKKSGVYLSVFLFAANLVSAAYIVSQHTFHNLAQMRCASTLNKLQLELSSTKDEMKLLRKAIETLEGGHTQLADSEDTIFGSSRAVKDHKQFLKSDELDAWKQSLKALEEDSLSAMSDFNEKLKSLH